MQLNFERVKRANQFIGLAIFLIILMKLDISKLSHIFSNMDIPYFSMAILLFIPFILVKSLRWKLLMDALEIRYSVKDSSIIYSAASFIGSITPGYLGDFIKVLYLKEDGHPFGKSFSSIFLDRLMDLMSILLLSLAGSLLIIKLYNVNLTIISYVLVFSISLSIIGMIIITRRNYMKMLILLLLKKMLPSEYKENARKYFEDISNSLGLFSKNDIILAISLTSMAWAINFAMAYLVALSMNLDMPVSYLMACIAISTLIAIIPISISGIGTRDATFVILFSFIGYNIDYAMAFSMAMWLLYIINTGMVLIAWMIKPINPSAIKKTA
jgi:uncharacterized protein (TIRG00374 family)